MMNPSFFRPLAGALLGVAVMLAGCSPQGATSAADVAQQQAQGQNAAAARNLDTYRQLLRIKNDEMAVTMGKDIVQRFPGSDAAKEVQQTLPAIEARYVEAAAKNRLDRLWLYQLSPMAGGTQSTATIQSGPPSGNDRVQLILRRHTSWGQSAFLYGSKPGFVCRGNCVIASMVDGKPVSIKAFAPSTGEPALMIRDDRAFIALLQKARKITMEVTLADGQKKQPLVYEVGGFDAAKWVGVGKPKKK